MSLVQVRNAFLANHAEVRDGLGYILGAFPEWWTVPVLPVASNLALVVEIDLAEDEIDQQLDFSFEIERPASTERLPLARLKTQRGKSAVQAPDAPIIHVVCMEFTITFEQPGRHTFLLTDASGAVLASMPLSVFLSPTELRGEITL